MIIELYGRLGESAICNYTRQILSGLAYLHSKSITHGYILVLSSFFRLFSIFLHFRMTRGYFTKFKGACILIDPKDSIKLTNFSIEKQVPDLISALYSAFSSILIFQHLLCLKLT